MVAKRDCQPAGSDLDSAGEAFCQKYNNQVHLFEHLKSNIGCFSGHSVLVHLLERFSQLLLQRARRKLPKKVRAMENRLMGWLRNPADNLAAVDKGILILQPLK